METDDQSKFTQLPNSKMALEYGLPILRKTSVNEALCSLNKELEFICLNQLFWG